VLVRRPAPPGIRPFLEINGDGSKAAKSLVLTWFVMGDGGAMADGDRR